MEIVGENVFVDGNVFLYEFYSLIKVVSSMKIVFYMEIFRRWNSFHTKYYAKDK